MPFIIKTLKAGRGKLVVKVLSLHAEIHGLYIKFSFEDGLMSPFEGIVSHNKIHGSVPLKFTN